jgi:hypothetical protein
MPDAKPMEEVRLVASDPRWNALAEAAERLLLRRRGQHGHFTAGDAEDVGFTLALCAVRIGPAAHGEMARLTIIGSELGARVYARSMFEDSFAGAIVVISTSLASSTLGSVRADELFHRSARVTFTPDAVARAADPTALRAFLGGVFRGFLAEAFNCSVDVDATEGMTFMVHLREGRDVNRGNPPC